MDNKAANVEKKLREKKSNTQNTVHTSVYSSSRKKVFTSWILYDTSEYCATK